MDLKTMKVPAIVELYNSGCINENNEVNGGLVEGAGYEDGEKLGIEICQATPCSLSKTLFALERDLKESYQVLGNEAIGVMLECMFEMWEFESWKAVELMLQHDEVFETYLYHFILGISDSFMGRAANCRMCMAQ